MKSVEVAYKEYTDWLLQRADLHEFLASLYGKTLLCSCRAPVGQCHGQLPVKLCEDYQRENEEIEDQEHGDADEEEEDHGDTDETKRSTTLTHSVGQAPAWQKFVPSIRDHGCRVFLEVVSGVAVLAPFFGTRGFPVALQWTSSTTMSTTS